MPAMVSTGPRRAMVFAVAAMIAIAAALIIVHELSGADARTAADVPTGELTEITEFGQNPSDLDMYVYVPESVEPDPALLVAVHWCTGSGPAFYDGTEFARLADERGFIVAYPSVGQDRKCFDVSSAQALTRGGGSDPTGIRSMVEWSEANYGIDPDRIFATGVSSGAMMTNVLLSLYPDVFSAGAAFAGVPFGCFATDDGSRWNSECSSGRRVHTPEEWGSVVREAYPGYDGERPRVQLWHGTADDLLFYQNFTESVKQWTDVHGLSQVPDATDEPRPNWVRDRYGGTDSLAPVETISLIGTDHGLMADGMAEPALDYMGLD